MSVDARTEQTKIRKKAEVVPSSLNMQGGSLTAEKTDQHSQSTQGKEPWGLRWRASVWFITFVVGLGMNSLLYDEYLQRVHPPRARHYYRSSRLLDPNPGIPIQVGSGGTSKIRVLRL